MSYELSDFRANIKGEKEEHSYTWLEEKYSVNRWYLWNIINMNRYIPPRKVRDKLGIRISRNRQSPIRIGKCTPEELAEIKALTPEQRRRRLLQLMPEWF